MEGWLWRLQLSVISYQLSVISGNLHCEASAQISVLFFSCLGELILVSVQK